MNRKWILASKLRKQKQKEHVIYKSCHKEFMLTNMTLENWKLITDNYSQFTVLKLFLSNICIIHVQKVQNGENVSLTRVTLNDKNIQTLETF